MKNISRFIKDDIEYDGAVYPVNPNKSSVRKMKYKDKTYDTKPRQYDYRRVS